MQDVFGLYKQLTPKENAHLKQLLSLHSKKNPQHLRIVNLLNILDRHKEVPSNHILLKAFNGTINQAYLYTLKNRLKDAIFDVLSDDYILGHTHLDKETLRSIKLRKRMLQVIQLYNTKGKSNVLLSTLNTIIQECKTYEIYPPLLDALIYKKALSPINFKSAFIHQSIDEEISKALSDYNIFIDIFQLFQRMRMNITLSYNENEQKVFLNKAIKSTQKKVFASQSDMARYFYYILELTYLEKIQQYKQATQVVNKYIQLIQNSKAVYRKARLASAFHYASTLYIYDGKYANAARFAQAAKEHNAIFSQNYIQACNSLFHALFYAQKYKAVQKQISEMIHAQTSINSLSLATYAFYQSCLFFQQKKFSKCKLSLLKNTELNKDKTGWDWQLRVLLILCYIELNEYEEAGKAIIALKQLYWRVQKGGIEINNRQKRILQILLKIQAADFQFKKIKTDLHKQRLLITVRNAWQPLSPELVRFDTWLKEKISTRRK